MMTRIQFLPRSSLAAGLLAFACCGLWSAPAPAQDLEADHDDRPRLTGLAQKMWDFAGVTPYLGPMERAASLQEVGGYGYYLDEANGFLHAVSWDGGCGCGEGFSVAAFKKKGGDWLLVKAGEQNTCFGLPMLQATEPLADILPPGFSLDSFFRAGEKPRPDRAFFLVEADIPEKGLDLRLTVRPLLNIKVEYDPAEVFALLSGREIFGDGGVTIDGGLESLGGAHSLMLFIQGVLNEGALDRYRGRTDFSPEDLRGLADDLVRSHNQARTWTVLGPEEVEELVRRLEGYYEIYGEYRRLGVRTFVLTWSRQDNRFRVKEKILLEPGPSFLDFLLNDGFAVIVAC